MSISWGNICCHHICTKNICAREISAKKICTQKKYMHKKISAPKNICTKKISAPKKISAQKKYLHQKNISTKKYLHTEKISAQKKISAHSGLFVCRRRNLQTIAGTSNCGRSYLQMKNRHDDHQNNVKVNKYKSPRILLSGRLKSNTGNSRGGILSQKGSCVVLRCVSVIYDIIIIIIMIF